MSQIKAAVSIEEALDIILSSIQPLACESLPLADAFNRVLGQDIHSGIMLPPLNCSAMDGYALLPRDTAGASRANPVTLRVIGEVQAGGQAAPARLAPGCAVRVMTGAPLPPEAEAVVKREDVVEGDGRITLFSPAPARANLRLAGENISPGDLALSQGDRLCSANLGILAALSPASVMVHRRPTVAIISTGDELSGLGPDLRDGQIRDVNASMLLAETAQINARPLLLGIAGDSREELRAVFAKALAAADLVLSTGGVSMGRYDFVRQVYEDLGIGLRFAGVRIRPGKTCAFGVKDGKPVFGLPGHPGSTLVTYHQFVRPALLRLMGQKRLAKPVVKARLEREITFSRSAHPHLLMGRFSTKDQELVVSPASLRKQALFQSMRRFNCLIMAPPGCSSLAAGQMVSIQMTSHDEV